MWTRETLKMNGKNTMNRNYWIFVLAALVLMLIGGETLNYNVNLDVNAGPVVTVEGIDVVGGDAVNDAIDSGLLSAYDTMTNINSNGIISWMLGSLAAGLAILVASLSILIKVFVGGPMSVGIRNAFLKGQSTKVEAKEILAAFKGSTYLNVVLIQFLRGLFTTLWTLLLVIPGIVKYYEYRMIPYLLAENPNMDRRTAFQISKQMMDGQKMDTFVLDLSFILWHMLSGITFGIAGIFYVGPYVESTNAQLYLALKANGANYEHL